MAPRPGDGAAAGRSRDLSGLVGERDVQRTCLAVLAATEVIAVAGDPAVDPVGQRANVRNPEDPSDPPAAGQDVQQLLDRGGALPGFAPWSHELDRLAVRARGDPREARHHTGRL